MVDRSKIRRLYVGVFNENRDPICFGPVHIFQSGIDDTDAIWALIEVGWFLSVLKCWPIGVAIEGEDERQ